MMSRARPSTNDSVDDLLFGDSGKDDAMPRHAEGPFDVTSLRNRRRVADGPKHRYEFDYTLSGS
jgi:hypothetical protein